LFLTCFISCIFNECNWATSASGAVRSFWISRCSLFVYLRFFGSVTVWLCFIQRAIKQWLIDWLHFFVIIIMNCSILSFGMIWILAWLRAGFGVSLLNAIHSFVRSFIHSFITKLCIAPLRGYYSEALHHAHWTPEQHEGLITKCWSHNASTYRAYSITLFNTE